MFCGSLVTHAHTFARRAVFFFFFVIVFPLTLLPLLTSGFTFLCVLHLEWVILTIAPFSQVAACPIKFDWRSILVPCGDNFQKAYVEEWEQEAHASDSPVHESVLKTFGPA